MLNFGQAGGNDIFANCEVEGGATQISISEASVGMTEFRFYWPDGVAETQTSGYLFVVQRPDTTKNHHIYNQQGELVTSITWGVGVPITIVSSDELESEGSNYYKAYIKNV